MFQFLLTAFSILLTPYLLFQLEADAKPKEFSHLKVKRAIENRLPASTEFRFLNGKNELVAILSTDRLGDATFSQLPSTKPKELTFSDCERDWGVHSRVMTQRDMSYLQQHDYPHDAVWQWFKNSPNAVYSKFQLWTADKRGVLIESIFDSCSQENGIANSKLVRFRVLILDLGRSSWINPATGKENSPLPLPRTD